MVKFACMLLMLVTTSGCCEVFGLCTSVNVHTSASSPNKIARMDNNGSIDRFAPGYAQSAQSRLTRLDSINNDFRACS
ncbi:MAG: hypothetical protein JO166_21240 [Deltaproteobacteria bacterium]|nr:hypothetical protein [Deltaproteobacteria bacterium]